LAITYIVFILVFILFYWIVTHNFSLDCTFSHNILPLMFKKNSHAFLCQIKVVANLRADWFG